MKMKDKIKKERSGSYKEFCKLWHTRLGDDKFDTFIKRRSIVTALDRYRYGFQEFCELWHDTLGDKFFTFFFEHTLLITFIMLALSLTFCFLYKVLNDTTKLSSSDFKCAIKLPSSRKKCSIDNVL